MKSFQVLSVGCALCAATLVEANSSERAQVLSERDATLARIVMVLEERQRVGLADEAVLLEARLALATFRRDMATTATQKIAEQKAIVALRAERVEAVKGRGAAGLSGELDLLRATEDLLAAKQLLLELTSIEREATK
jgi:outer membrane protein TolC